MQIALETITPEMAREYLKHNTKNRKIRQQHCLNMVRDMQSGDWQMNGESIKFNCDGQLLDGQHRLTAITKAERPVQMLVVRGIDRDSVKTIDAGAKRTAGDALTFHGAKSANSLSAACRYAISMRGNPTMRPLSVTNTEVVRFYELHRGIEAECKNQSRAPSGFGSIIAAVAYAFRFSGENVDDCVEAWLDGGGSKNFPPKVARERILREIMHGGCKMSTQERCRLVAHSFNAALERKTWQIAKIPELVWIPGWTAR